MSVSFTGRAQVLDGSLKCLACLGVGDADAFAASSAALVETGGESNDVGAVGVLLSTGSSIAVLA